MTNIVGYISLSDPAVESKEVLLPWQRMGLQQTATGYGRKLATSRMVKLNGRWRRIYVCCFSNAGTAYVTKGNDWIVIHD